jgi:hypothetical protein
MGFEVITAFRTASILYSASTCFLLPSLKKEERSFSKKPIIFDQNARGHIAGGSPHSHALLIEQLFK